MNIIPFAFVLFGAILPHVCSALPLQDLIDAAPDGGVLAPPKGVYEGPVRISHPIILDGSHGVTIDAGGEGSVIYLSTDGAIVKNLTLRNSGDQHNDVDAGIQVKGNYNTIKNNSIENCLFGVDLSQSDNNIVRKNYITSKGDRSLGLRGDAIRLWYSKNNEVSENTIVDSRDVVVWYSESNRLVNNSMRDGRYGIHFMYSQYNEVTENSIEGNSVGIFLMYSDNVVLRRNNISHGDGPTAMGIGLKESSGITIEGNNVFYCSRGMYFDVSPLQPDTINRIARNTIAFNGMGVVFHNDWVGNELVGNVFRDNFQTVSVNTWASVKRNLWEGNYWDTYLGFDQDNDGIGDTPYKMKLYSDRLWIDVPSVSFFRSSPSLTVIDFLERLAPFSEPLLLLEDKSPILNEQQAMLRTSASRSEYEKDLPKRYDPFGLYSE
ncbi:MAG: nitrous oxide reductase family maturation protein NosD [Bdellovibrionales bacterium]|nr:nitrous oxide reductase family maturation protein NosD [Bdellovibrionales bacterium]